MTRDPSTRWTARDRSTADMSPWLRGKLDRLRNRFREEFAHTDTVVICSLEGGVKDEDSVEGRTCDRCREYCPAIWRHRYVLSSEGYVLWVEAKLCTPCAHGEGFPVGRARDAFGVST